MNSSDWLILQTVPPSPPLPITTSQGKRLRGGHFEWHNSVDTYIREPWSRGVVLLGVAIARQIGSAFSKPYVVIMTLFTKNL